MLRHRAREIPFQDLESELEDRVRRGLSYKKTAPWNEQLALYTYTKDTVFEKAWDDITVLCRGLIVDHVRGTVVATPFPKFFNLGELQLSQVPDLPFTAREKVDGSLIILAHDGTNWFTATKGSFISDQAKWAAQWLWENCNDIDVLDKTSTYLFEAVYPENRIVVKYDKPELVFLGGYDDEGYEFLDIEAEAEKLGIRAATYVEFDTLDEAAAHSKTLPGTHEGYIIRFYDGTRIKLKGDEYCRLHRLISRITPLAIWDLLRANELTDAVIKDIPEEFRADFDQIVTIIRTRVMGIVGIVARECSAIKHLSDKEVGLHIQNYPESIRRFIFPFRKCNGQIPPGSTLWEGIFRAVRPTANKLEGYVPSNSMNRVMEELES
jgi:RNA ligase